ncbi:unnamed protein product [Nippostrongylus brasiliensis]|uniref:7TM_GPCR_Srx domain-containing protein n=1 Tax=Nippostrongylus brasiliensis TaxID=27835 RepID=A0A0N4Y0N1_NIPBR|nr:unnamed protein product [Nippostrongylus brasiliensis]
MSIFEWVMLSASRLGYETGEIRTKTKPLIRYFGILFFMGNFLLGVERMVAVLFVSWYEKYVSTAITAFIVVITVLNWVVPPVGITMSILLIPKNWIAAGCQGSKFENPYFWEDKFQSLPHDS